MNDLTKNILLWVVIVFVLLLVFSRYMPAVGQPQEIPYSTFLDEVKAERVESVVMQAEMIYGTNKDKSNFKTRNPEDCPAFEMLRTAQEDIDDWYVQYMQSLDETSLNETVHFTFIGGGEGAMSRADILMHVVNHTTYHRGHVATMMYNISAYPPTTDLPVFLREAGG